MIRAKHELGIVEPERWISYLILDLIHLSIRNLFFLAASIHKKNYVFNNLILKVHLFILFLLFEETQSEILKKSVRNSLFTVHTISTMPRLFKKGNQGEVKNIKRSKKGVMATAVIPFFIS